MTVEKPTILFFSHSAEFYGAERILFSIVKSLQEEFIVHVALPAEGPLTKELAQWEGVQVHRFTLTRFTTRPVDLCANFFIFVPFVWSVCRLLRQIRPDVVYCNTIRNIFTATIAHWSDYPVLFHFHERNISGLPGKLFAFIASKVNDINIFVCDYAANSYTQLVASLLKKSKVIYNGVEVSPRPLLLLGQPQSYPLLMTIAQLAPHKRIEDLLRAMPLVLKNYPTAQLVIFGEGSDRPKLESLIAEFSLGTHVTLAGFIPDAASRLADADIFLAPFAEEGLNTAAIEAMLCGKPVVAAASGGLLEIVENGKTGLFHDLGHHEQIASQIEYLSESPELRLQMGAKGQQRAVHLFNTQRQMKQLSVIVRELAESRRIAVEGRV